VVFLHNLSWSWLVHLTMKRSSNVMLMMLSVASSTSRFRLWAGTRYRSSLRKSNVSFIRKIIPIRKGPGGTLCLLGLEGGGACFIGKSLCTRSNDGGYRPENRGSLLS